MKRVVYLAFIALLVAPGLYAETLTLKSGKIVEGKIVEKSDNFIKIEIEGIPLTYYLDQLDLIDGQKVVLPVAKSAETVTGQDSPSLAKQQVVAVEESPSDKLSIVEKEMLKKIEDAQSKVTRSRQVSTTKMDSHKTMELEPSFLALAI